MRNSLPVAWLLLALCVILLECPAAAAEAEGRGEAGSRQPDPIDLVDLMELLASSGGVRAAFHQTRHLALLEDPIETWGVLYFAPPDTLARRTTRPGDSSIVVRRSTVAFRDETGVQTLQLGSSEVAQAIVGNLLALLRGDLPALRDRYTLDFRTQVETPDAPSPEAELPEAQSWELDLVPRSKGVRAVIERVRFAGHRNTLSRMETREANGDITIDRFSDVALGLEWDAGSFERIFSLDTASDAK